MHLLNIYLKSLRKEVKNNMFECKANSDDFIGYRIKLYPTESQKEILDKQFGCYRWIYNWGIDIVNQFHKLNNRFIKYLELCDEFEKVRNNPDYYWLKEFPLNSARIALRSVIKAFRYFFERRNNYPKYKSKRKSKMIFGVRGERVYLKPNGYASIEGLGPRNFIMYKHPNLPEIKEGSHIYNAWISCDKDNYWLSFQIEYPRKIELEKDQSASIGIDLGLKHLATLSDGTIYNSPNSIKLNRKKKRLNRKMSKIYEKMIKQTQQTRTKFEDIPKSNNLLKLEKQYRATVRKIANIQNTFVHTITKQIVDRNPSSIVIEDINPKKMAQELKGSKMKGEVYRQSLSRFRQRIQYKAKERGIPVIIADKTYPSSQLCSCCGNRYKVGGSRVYECPNCGLIIDRDLNAAINLQKLGI